MLQVLCPLCRVDWPGVIQAESWAGDSGDAQALDAKPRYANLHAHSTPHALYLCCTQRHKLNVVLME